MTEETATVERPLFPNTKHGDADPSANLGSEPVRRRGPGRPRKDAPSTAPVSPGATPIPQDSAKPKGKPGRKPKKVTLSEAERSALGKQIVGLHMISATMFSIPELVISEQEGELMAGALANMAEEYGLSLTGKTGALIQLVGVAGMIYLPRYFHMQQRVKEARIATVQEKPADTSAQVMPDNVSPIAPHH